MARPRPLVLDAVVTIVAGLTAACGPKAPTAAAPAVDPPAEVAAPEAAAAPAPDATPIDDEEAQARAEQESEADREEEQEGFGSGEQLGHLSLDMSEKEVVAILGDPESRSARKVWVDKNWHSIWSWRRKGVSVVMDSIREDGHEWVGSITIRAPSPLRTRAGIGIGSTRAEVVAAYREHQDREHSTELRFIAGSIDNGVIFTFKADRVLSIFIGPDRLVAP